ncbi:MAG: hypothetical protein U9O87_11365 [Verrucomicrobiota bacterium]|nr:hypothetical protein [Verrucomicrobiota bacterium]
MTKFYRIIFSVIISALLFAGCAKQIKQDTEPFKKAVTEYLQEQHMGMKVYEFKELQVTEDKATAKIKMQEASGITNLKVTWSFEFDKKDAWKVTSHKE